jgi:hypothetical protein
MEKGFKQGRQALAKELATLCVHKNKVDVGEIVALLSRYDLMPRNGSLGVGGMSPPCTRAIRHQANPTHTQIAEGSTTSAVHVFQQVFSVY